MINHSATYRLVRLQSTDTLSTGGLLCIVWYSSLSLFAGTGLQLKLLLLLSGLAYVDVVVNVQLTPDLTDCTEQLL